MRGGIVCVLAVHFSGCLGNAVPVLHIDGGYDELDGKPRFVVEPKSDLTLVTWAHGVNSREELQAAISDGVDYIEADVSLGKVNGTGPDLPIMAHPPDVESDISLVDFLDIYRNAGSTQGIKLDFKTIEVFEESIDDLLSRDWLKDVKLMLNADILSGPVNSTSEPVDADRFLTACASNFSFAMVSAGWKTNFGFGLFRSIREGDYTREHVDEMIQVLRRNNISQPVTFPVRSGIAASQESRVNLQHLIESIPGSTLTLWSTVQDCVDYYGAAALINTVDKTRIYVDVFPDERRKIFQYVTE